jgi:hypothetical protein
MNLTLTLTQEQYEALIALARLGAAASSDPPAVNRNLDAFLRDLEVANGITRYAVWVQWQEQDQPLPPTTAFPATWPPSQRVYIEYLTRPIAKVDVMNVLAQRASKPTNVLVTKDPGATLGWTPLAQFFLQ